MLPLPCPIAIVWVAPSCLEKLSYSFGHDSSWMTFIMWRHNTHSFSLTPEGFILSVNSRPYLSLCSCHSLPGQHRTPHVYYFPFMASPAWLLLIDWGLLQGVCPEIMFSSMVGCSLSQCLFWALEAHLFFKLQIHIWVNGPGLTSIEKMQRDENLHVWETQRVTGVNQILMGRGWVAITCKYLSLVNAE